MKKAMFIAVIAKKKPALSCYIFTTKSLFLFTNLRISCRERTPPPLKSVSGYWPWKPSRIHYFPDTWGGWEKY